MSKEKNEDLDKVKEILSQLYNFYLHVNYEYESVRQEIRTGRQPTAPATGEKDSCEVTNQMAGRGISGASEKEALASLFELSVMTFV